MTFFIIFLIVLVIFIGYAFEVEFLFIAGWFAFVLVIVTTVLVTVTTVPNSEPSNILENDGYRQGVLECTLGIATAVDMGNGLYEIHRTNQIESDSLTYEQLLDLATEYKERLKKYENAN